MIYTKDQALKLHELTFAYLIIEEKEHVLYISLNRPEKKNAMNPVFFNELAYALIYASFENSIWAVVIRANGDVFSAGADLKAFAGKEQEQTKSTIPAPNGEVVIGEIFNSLHKPCIIAVHAPVYAGGFLIVCGGTHVVATNNAIFSLPEVKRGIFPMQVMAALLDIMPKRKALDLCIRGRTITAAEAMGLGIVTQLAKPEELDASVNELLEEITANSPTAIRHGLKAYQEVRDMPNSQQHPYLKQMLHQVLKSRDAAEGLSAFMEKRKPEWTGE